MVSETEGKTVQLTIQQISSHLKEKRLHGVVDERVTKQPEAVESQGQHNHVIVPEDGVIIETVAAFLPTQAS